MDNLVIKTVPLDGYHILEIVLMSFGSVFWIELAKLLYQLYKKLFWQK